MDIQTFAVRFRDARSFEQAYALVRETPLNKLKELVADKPARSASMAVSSVLTRVFLGLMDREQLSGPECEIVHKILAVYQVDGWESRLNEAEVLLKYLRQLAAGKASFIHKYGEDVTDDLIRTAAVIAPRSLPHAKRVWDQLARMPEYADCAFVASGQTMLERLPHIQLWYETTANKETREQLVRSLMELDHHERAAQAHKICKDMPEEIKLLVNSVFRVQPRQPFAKDRWKKAEAGKSA